MEGRTERCTETYLPSSLPWGDQYIEHIRKALYIAYKFSDEPVPDGLLKDGEVI